MDVCEVRIDWYQNAIAFYAEAKVLLRVLGEFMIYGIYGKKSNTLKI